MEGPTLSSLDELSPLNFDNFVSGLNNYEAAGPEETNLSVILNLLDPEENVAQSDANMGQNIMEDPHWPS